MKYTDREKSENRRHYMDRDTSIIRKEYNENYKKLTWPINVEIYDVDDKNLKNELCLIVTNLPVNWKKCDIMWFFREYFYKLAINDYVLFPLIEQVYLIKNEASAILACHDRVSKETIQSLSQCIVKNTRDKKKIVFTICPYYKNYEAYKNKKQTEIKEKERNANDNENCSDSGKNYLKKLRKHSLKLPRRSLLIEDGVEWPSNVDLRSFNDIELRKKLYVFGRYKPLHWGVKELFEFLKLYFETLKKDNENFEIPEISDIWADKGINLATFACKNEKSRFYMLLIRACYLNDDDAKKNFKNSLRGWIEFEKWTHFKSKLNSRYKNYKSERKDYNKHSSIHEHIIDKSYYRKNYKKPIYDNSRHKISSFNHSMNLSKLNNNSNYYFYKEDKHRRNNENQKHYYKKRSSSPYFNKYKKRYSRSSSKSYHKKKYRSSKSYDLYKNDDYSWGKHKSYNKKYSDSFSRNSYGK